MNHQILFLDMDGTMAKFYEQANCLEQMWLPGFFERLKPYANLIEAVKMLHDDGIKICVISAIHRTHFNAVAIEKQQWLRRHLPKILHDQSGNVIFTDIGESKAAAAQCYASQRGVKTTQCYLLDDYNRNLYDWRNHCGKAIKFVNEINDRGVYGPLWNGERIRHDFDPYRIVEELTDIMRDT